MYNDFVIVGPNTDPAHIRVLTDARKALTQIADAKALFASRGDDSGPTGWNCDSGSPPESSPTHTVAGIVILVRAWGRR
jgi:ABC-type tungstate transport system permease subunit